MQTLLIDARDIFFSVALITSAFVQLSSLFISSLPLSLLAPTLLLTPKMDCVRSVAPSNGIVTFTYPLNDLDT